jgi:hypothetical protein
MVEVLIRLNCESCKYTLSCLIAVAKSAQLLKASMRMDAENRLNLERKSCIVESVHGKRQF